LVAVPVRHWGRWVSALLVLLALALLGRAFASADVHWSVTRHFLTDADVFKGAERTLLISVLAQAMGIAIGVVVAVMRQSGNPVTTSAGWAFVWFFRGTPVLLQLLIWYNLGLVFPTLFGHRTVDVMTPFLAALLGLGINEGAYMAEIVRAGIASVDEGQTEAAQALGMTRGLTMRRIVLPQAMRVIIPPTGNEFISMLKTSSLASVIQYGELVKISDTISSRNLQVMELLFTITVYYLVLTTVFSIGQYYLERRFARGASRELPLTPWQRVRTNLMGRPRL
jgi:polar amino acid transport system permease protein